MNPTKRQEQKLVLLATLMIYKKIFSSFDFQRKMNLRKTWFVLFVLWQVFKKLLVFTDGTVCYVKKEVKKLAIHKWFQNFEKLFSTLTTMIPHTI